ncbi:PaaI family thioesterase [Rhodococcus sp. D2-41]|uniref:PaaI family thioesterase n=1 Tax=Speluncibacter jeojiensis TaxID=2710754 RepID=UPI00241071AB|nr:PaaI family thioesterase [Rhodococcus sp. D2-41]MDG3009275.1 PaaI family thioesterase [Rhodococcus sp. D2-41]
MSSTWSLPADIEIPVRHPMAPEPGAQMREHWEKCFGCGSDQPTGLGMTFIAGEGLTVEAQFDVAHRYQGGPGVIHGGILSTGFDEAMGTCCMLLANSVVTAHLEVDYARPIVLGSTLKFSCRIDGAVRRKVYTSAEAYVDGSNAPVATARALFVQIDMDQHFKDTKQFIDHF